MNNKKRMIYFLILGCFLTSLMSPLVTRADEDDDNDIDKNGHISVLGSDSTDPLDPEDPLDPVNPGDEASTDGALRFDYVSTINFGSVQITNTNRKYSSLAQLFLSDTPARASYVQITDLRGGVPGWSLQLKQETQFQNNEGKELSGATLSFDKGWANSSIKRKAPEMFRDTIAIDQIGTAYQVASASEGSGNGTWLISFGASATNENGQENTLTLLKDANGDPVIDTSFNKEAYKNSAISLSVPEKTNIVPGEYHTELTWILQAAP